MTFSRAGVACRHFNFCGCAAILEIEAQRELHDAGRFLPGQVGDYAEGWADYAGIGQTKVWMVEGVKGVGAKLQSVFFAEDGEVFGDAQIEIGRSEGLVVCRGCRW